MFKQNEIKTEYTKYTFEIQDTRNKGHIVYCTFFSQSDIPNFGKFEISFMNLHNTINTFVDISQEITKGLKELQNKLQQEADNDK